MGDSYITLSLVIVVAAILLFLTTLIIVLVKRKPTWWILVSLIICSAMLISPLLVGGEKNSNTSVNQNTVSEEATTDDSEIEDVDLSVTFEDIYRDYEKNKLVAEDLYEGNRYQVTAVINNMTTSGLFNLTGGATLTMEMKIDNTIVFFKAEFEKEQEEALKQVVVGDTITFEGKCLSLGMWTECEIIE